MNQFKKILLKVETHKFEYFIYTAQYCSGVLNSVL